MHGRGATITSDQGCALGLGCRRVGCGACQRRDCRFRVCTPHVLSFISLMIVRRGLANGAMLRRMLANWTYCARRPFMCLLGDSFKHLPKVTDDVRVYRIPKEIREYLKILSFAGRFMLTDSSATHSSKLICTDASFACMGAVSARVHPMLQRSFGVCGVVKNGRGI